MKFSLLVKVLVFTLSFVPAISLADDGSLGASSTGEFEISVEVPALVQVSNLEDLNFGTFVPDEKGALILDDNFCIYRNSSAGLYSITANSPEGGFNLKNGSESVPYEVFFNNETGTTSNTQLSYNTQLASQTGANSTSPDCSTGGFSANIQIRIPTTNLKQVPAGNYQGNLILNVEPA